MRRRERQRRRPSATSAQPPPAPRGNPESLATYWTDRYSLRTRMPRTMLPFVCIHCMRGRWGFGGASDGEPLALAWVGGGRDRRKGALIGGRRIRAAARLLDVPRRGGLQSTDRQGSETITRKRGRGSITGLRKGSAASGCTCQRIGKWRRQEEGTYAVLGDNTNNGELLSRAALLGGNTDAGIHCHTGRQGLIMVTASLSDPALVGGVGECAARAPAGLPPSRSLPAG